MTDSDSSDPIAFGDAIEKGLKDYEQYYADADLDSSLKIFEQLFLYRERIMILIEAIKLDILDTYEKVSE